MLIGYGQKWDINTMLPKISEITKNRIKQLATNKWTDKDIARTLSLTKKTVREIREGFGIQESKHIVGFVSMLKAMRKKDVFKGFNMPR